MFSIISTTHVSAHETKILKQTAAVISTLLSSLRGEYEHDISYKPPRPLYACLRSLCPYDPPFFRLLALDLFSAVVIQYNKFSFQYWLNWVKLFQSIPLNFRPSHISNKNNNNNNDSKNNSEAGHEYGEQTLFLLVVYSLGHWYSTLLFAYPQI
jgi:hypothetical protein